MTTQPATHDSALPMTATGRPLSIFRRFVLTPPMLIMTLIGVRLILDPVHASAAHGVTLSTPEAMTDTRVLGGLALTLAVVIASSLFSRAHVLRGNLTVTVLMLVLLAIRLFGYGRDGTTIAMGDQRTKVIGESVFLFLNTLAIAAHFLRPGGERLR